MAAKLQQGSRLASFGNRLIGQIRAPNPVATHPLSLSRAVHVSVYDKDPDEHVHPTVVPDYLIQPLPEIYWAPHPETGVFSPTSNHKLASSGEKSNAGTNSSLEQIAFFRPLEDLDKPVEN
ncbi:hypothetical protein CASFOL_004228 [Castilleja foliolosa]|uniref:Uncharacterized protein n=1 Tax=Castilleja foliolosa TaxID=1961234 RepID=A0ABD3EAL9_9LAMI